MTSQKKMGETKKSADISMSLKDIPVSAVPFVGNLLLFIHFVGARSWSVYIVTIVILNKYVLPFATSASDLVGFVLSLDFVD